MMGMGSQVANYAGFSGDLQRGAPDRLLVCPRFQQCRRPTGSIFDLYQPDSSYLPTAHHLASLPHHWIATVAVGHAEDQAPLACQPQQLNGLFYIGCQWLIADDIDAAFKKGSGNGVMAIVRRHNAHDLNAIISLCLLLGHLLPEAVTALWYDAKRSGEVPTALCVRGEHPCQQSVAFVITGGIAMCPPDI